LDLARVDKFLFATGLGCYIIFYIKQHHKATSQVIEDLKRGNDAQHSFLMNAGHFYLLNTAIIINNYFNGSDRGAHSISPDKSSGG